LEPLLPSHHLISPPFAEDFTEKLKQEKLQKKTLQAFMPEGLHPVFLTLFISQHSLLPAEQ